MMDKRHKSKDISRKPVEQDENTNILPKTTEASESVLDLLTNLAQRVEELERKLGEYTRKVDGLEADIQNINIDLGTVEENVNKALTNITTTSKIRD